MQTTHNYFAMIKTLKNVVQILQQSCQKLSPYFIIHYLKLNTSKNELIIFSKKTSRSSNNTKISNISDKNKMEENHKSSNWG